MPVSRSALRYVTVRCGKLDVHRGEQALSNKLAGEAAFLRLTGQGRESKSSSVWYRKPK